MKKRNRILISYLSIFLILFSLIPAQVFAKDKPVSSVDIGYATSTEGIKPTLVDDNTPQELTQQFPTTDWQTYNGVQYRYYLDADEKQRLEWSVSEGYYFEGSIMMKGGSAYFDYLYTAEDQIGSDSELCSPKTGPDHDGPIPNISHIVISGSVIEKPTYGSLVVNKTVLWGNYTPSAEESFDIKITGPSYPDGDIKTVTVAPDDWTGSVAWDELLVGDYTIEEVNFNSQIWTPVISSSPAHVVKDSETAVDITNTYEPKGEITLIKHLEGDPITEKASFHFTIVDENQQEITTETLTLNPGDTIASTTFELPYGQYTITEAEADLPGSEFNQVSVLINGENSETGEFEVDDETTEIQIDFTNHHTEPKGVIIFAKDIQLIEGAEGSIPAGVSFDFALKNEAGDVVDEFTLPNETDDPWVYTSEDLVSGTYTIEETSFVPGYEPITRKITVNAVFAIGALNQVSTSMTNIYDPNTGNLIVYKHVVADDDITPIDDTFEFELYRQIDGRDTLVQVDGKNSFAITTTDSEGSYIINNLPSGDYKVVEVYSTHSHEYTVVGSDTIDVFVNKGNTEEVTFTNHFTPDPEIELQIVKVIVDSEGNILNNHSSSEFEVTLTNHQETLTEQDTFAGAYVVTTETGQTLVKSYYSWPTFVMDYMAEETNIPDYFSFLRFEFQYFYGAEGSEMVTSEDSTFPFDLYGDRQSERIPTRVVLTVVNLYTPPTDPDLGSISITKLITGDTPSGKATFHFTIVGPEGESSTTRNVSIIGQNTETLDGLPFGTYTINEVDVPNRYTLQTSNGLTVILNSESNSETVSFTNNYTAPREPREPREPNPPTEDIVTEVPLSAPEVAPAEIVEDILPLDVPVLPQTGELPSALFYGIGGLLSGIGVLIRRKK